MKCCKKVPTILTINNHVTRLTRGARPASGQVFRDQRAEYGDRWIALTRLTSGCYYDDATVRDSKVWPREMAPIVCPPVLGQ